jgi:outer membrane protein TolC
MLRIFTLAVMAASIASAQAPAATLTLTLEDALKLARANALQLLSADLAARIARENAVQAKAALLPTLNWQNGFVYTQPNGTDTGVFIAANAPREYINQASVHADVFAPGKRADYQAAIAGEAIARARVAVAQRGLVETVVQNYYSMAAAARHVTNAQQSVEEARQFADITRKQEAGGEAAHSDVVKAHLQLEQRLRDVQDAQLALDKARIGFGVILFPDFRQDFTVVDDLEQVRPLPALTEIESQARGGNPDIRAAEAAFTQESFGVRSARAGLLPTLSVDYFYGIQASQYALRNEFGQRNLGSSVVASFNVPVWNWGALRSRVKQAELKMQQARTDLNFAQRQLLAEVHAFYLEGNAASTQISSLKRSLDLSEESLRLTVLRYQAGEVSVLEVVDAQAAALGARNSYADGLARYRVALGALQTLTGSF